MCKYLEFKITGRVTAALKALLSVKSVRDCNCSKAELKQFANSKMDQLSAGDVLEKIIQSPGLPGIAFRIEMNRQLPVVRLPVEILGMIFQESIALTWFDNDPENQDPGICYLNPEPIPLLIARLSHVSVRYTVLQNVPGTESFLDAPIGGR